MDIGNRLKLKEVNERLPYFALTRAEGGSGFPIAWTLRHFFVEYLDRLIKIGPFSSHFIQYHSKFSYVF
jgi:hypothetical protein